VIVRRSASNISANDHRVHHGEKGENVNSVFLVYRDVLLCHVDVLAETVPETSAPLCCADDRSAERR